MGTLVHRLLQRVGIATDITDNSLRSHLSSLIRTDEVLDPAGRQALIDGAVRIYRQVVRRPEVHEVYRSGRALHEVPFTMIEGGTVRRGTIDCLVQDANRITVLEFKTGRPHPEHQAQVELYARAARRIFSQASVEPRLVYTDGLDAHNRNDSGHSEV